MSRRFRCIAGAVMLAALAGCAMQPSPFVANVTTLAEPLPAIPSRGVYRFVAVPPAEAGQLQYRAVRDAVSIGLTHVGLTPEALASGRPATVVVAFQLSSEPFQAWSEVAAPAPWPPLGMGPYAPYYGGYWGGGWGFGMMVPPVAYQTVPVQGWRHVLTVSMRDAAAPDVEIYYTKAVHESLDENALEALPYLVEAALEGYPQAGNQTRRVEIPRQR